MDGFSKERRCNADTSLPLAWFLTSATKYVRSALYWVITQRVTLPPPFSFLPLECFITTAAIWHKYQIITHKPRAFYQIQFGTQLRGPRLGENVKQQRTGPSPELHILNASRLTRTDWNGMHLSAAQQHSHLIQQLHHRLACRICMKRHTNSASPLLSLGNLVSPDLPTTLAHAVKTFT
jgi:hypothetical protein